MKDEEDVFEDKTLVRDSYKEAMLNPKNKILDYERNEFKSRLKDLNKFKRDRRLFLLNQAKEHGR